MSDYSNVPFDENPDDFVIGDVTGGDKSAEQIEQENFFAPVPPGEQEMVVVGFTGAPRGSLHKVFVNGTITGVELFSVGVKLGMVSNPKRTVTAWFTLPPSGAKPGSPQHTAYFYGIPESKTAPGTPSNLSPGSDANQFSHFINRLGFSFPPGGSLEPAGQRLGNWKGRRIVCTIVAGKGTYVDKNGVERPRDSQVKWFSYKPAGTPTHTDTGIAPAPTTAPSRPAPALAGVGAGVNGTGAGHHDNGLDSI